MKTDKDTAMVKFFDHDGISADTTQIWKMRQEFNVDDFASIDATCWIPKGSTMIHESPLGINYAIISLTREYLMFQ